MKNNTMNKHMSDFEKFAIALYNYKEKAESYDSFCEVIRNLECYDFRFFYFKAHYLYKKLGKIEEAKMYVDKAIEAFSSRKYVVNTTDDFFCENAIDMFVPICNGNYIYVRIDNKEIIENIYLNFRK